MVIMQSGWIRLHRSLLDNGLLCYPEANTLFIHLLLKAVWKDHKYATRYGVIELKRGQVVVGRKQLAMDLKSTERKIRTALDMLSKMEIVTIETTNHFSIITLVNYDKFQGDDQQTTSETTNGRPRLDQRATTEEEGKKEKNEKKDSKPAYAGDDDFNTFWKAYPRHTSKGDALKAWKQLKPPIESVLEALTWQRKDQEWTKDSGQWIPYPGKYLRARRWEDDKPGWAYREAKATQPAVKMEVHSHQMTKVIETYQDGSQLIECAHDGCNYRINRGA